MKIRILCAGTFDLLHNGHIEFLKKSKSLAENSELVVIVARDDTSEKIKNKSTINNQKIRLSRIKALDFVDNAFLGYEKSRLLERVVSLNPNIIALGYDQWAKEDWLLKELQERGLNVKIVRMPKFDKGLI